MKSTARSLTSTALMAALVFGLTGCENMSHRDRTTAAGAAIGGVAGSVLTDGSATGTVGGAAVGGVVGNQIGKRK